MTSITRGTWCAQRRIGLLLACLIASPALMDAQDTNTVKSVRTVNSTVEIELESSKEFPIRNEVVVLRIGKTEISRSKSPKSGSLKTLIFMLTPAEFEQLKDGDQMIVTYGRDNDEVTAMSGRSAHDPRWDFGKFSKALLGR